MSRDTEYKNYALQHMEDINFYERSLEELSGVKEPRKLEHASTDILLEPTEGGFTYAYPFRNKQYF